MTKSYTVEQARQKLENYCAYQDRCHAEVEAKLRSMNMIPQATEAIILHLLEHGFLDEERFAKSFARGKHRIKGWGNVRIVNELKARHVSQRNINTALKEIPDEEYSTTFERLALRQWESLPGPNSQPKRRKFCDFLLRKGFESDLVYQKMKELERG